MRWLKHMTATASDEKVAAYLDDCGPNHRLEGYGFFWMLLETIAAQIESGSEKCSATYTLPTWSRLLYSHHHTVSKYLGKLEVTGMVTVRYAGSSVEVTVPNLLKYRDEYSRKSGHSPDKRRTKEQIQNTETDTEKKDAPKGAEVRSISNEDSALSETAKRMCDRHPGEHTCGPAEARKQLKAIIGKLPKAERIPKLAAIEGNHLAWCESEAWKKDGGKYAKGLANWLAPTMGRFDVPPSRAPTKKPSDYNPTFFDITTITGEEPHAH